MTTRIAAILKKTPLYPLCCDVADRLRAPRLARECRQWAPEDDRRRTFYAQFVAPGDTVFDVGANLGNRTRVFLRLGARVVAVEPQSRCAGLLARAFGAEPAFCLERTALGAAPGHADMLICRTNALSTLSREWVRTVQSSGRFANYKWERTERVAVDTLDRLIARHGRPSFVKIDVEGFEREVLAGLSTPVRALSFEFTRENLEQALRCIDLLARFPGARFRLSLGESFAFSGPDWVPAGAIGEILAAAPPDAFGDLYVLCDA